MSGEFQRVGGAREHPERVEEGWKTWASSSIGHRAWWASERKNIWFLEAVEGSGTYCANHSRKDYALCAPLTPDSVWVWHQPKRCCGAAKSLCRDDFIHGISIYCSPDLIIGYASTNG